MNNAILTVFKKELARFFKDKRTLVALVMPGILLYVIYTLMGGAMSSSFAPDDDYDPIVYADNMPNSVETLLNAAKIEVTQSSDKDSELEKISDSEADLLMIFPQDFDEIVARGDATPNIQIYFNSSSKNSSEAYQVVTSVLDAYEASMSNIFDINNSENIKFDLATDESVTGMIFSMIMPMLLIMLLFSGCMAVAPESIAGEKERGTIAALLVTPTKRSHIAIGKILALSVMALISGASSTLGVLLSLPKLMGGTVELDGSVYGMSDYAMLAVVILSTVLVLITLISIVSAYAKTVKEASTYVTPLMIISMLIGLGGMFGSAATNPLLYLIPVYNSVQCMIGIFSFNVSIVNMTLTVISNVAVTGIGVFLLTRMFNNEKIMFNRS